jgi:hypothetical protein
MGSLATKRLFVYGRRGSPIWLGWSRAVREAASNDGFLATDLAIYAATTWRR